MNNQALFSSKDKSRKFKCRCCNFCLALKGLRVHHNTKWVGNGLKLNWGKFIECW